MLIERSDVVDVAGSEKSGNAQDEDALEYLFHMRSFFSINSKIIAFAFALAAEIERNLISQRTREALADRRAAGVLGRPKGSSVKKKLIINNLDDILKLRAEGVSISAIAQKYKVHRNTLHNYLKAYK